MSATKNAAQMEPGEFAAEYADACLVCECAMAIMDRDAARESALLAEVAAWLEREVEKLPGCCFGCRAVRRYAANLRDGSWRSHPSRGAGEAER